MVARSRKAMNCVPCRRVSEVDKKGNCKKREIQLRVTENRSDGQGVKD